MNKNWPKYEASVFLFNKTLHNFTILSHYVKYFTGNLQLQSFKFTKAFYNSLEIKNYI